MQSFESECQRMLSTVAKQQQASVQVRLRTCIVECPNQLLFNVKLSKRAWLLSTAQRLNRRRRDVRNRHMMEQHQKMTNCVRQQRDAMAEQIVAVDTILQANSVRLKFYNLAYL